MPSDEPVDDKSDDEPLARHESVCETRTIDMFEILKDNMAKGAYGAVSLAKDKETG